MYGDFLKTQEHDNPHPPSEPQPMDPRPPSTAVKRHVFGRSTGRVEPLRIGADPELSQLYRELAKKDRRSQGALSSRNDSHEWSQSNNTIPETLNSSREWNMPCRMNVHHSASQSNVSGTLESTPLKSSQVGHPSLRVPFTMDKENFYTPQKTGGAPPVTTPAIRCPLSALPVDGAPAKDTIDGTLNNKDLGCVSGLDKNLLGSTSKTSGPSYNNAVFRTPQCQTPSSQQSAIQQSGSFRQRAYGVSSTKMFPMQPKIPLHPTVAAGQEQAKQRLQREAQYQPSSNPSENGASRRLADFTGFQATQVSVRQTPAQPGQATVESQPSTSDANLPSSGSLLPSSRAVETTPLKPVSNYLSGSSRQILSHPTPVFESQTLDFSVPSEGKSTMSSTWLPHLKTGNSFPHGDIGSVAIFKEASPWRHDDTKPMPSETPSSKRKLGLQDFAEPLPETKQDLRAKVSPEPPKENKSHHIPKIVEPAKLTVAPPTNNVSKSAQLTSALPNNNMPEKAKDTKCVSQQPVNVVEPVKVVSVEVAKSSENETKKTFDSEKKSCARGSGQIAVNGHVYSILSLLGLGGSSKVFQVLDPENSQLKAVKCVNLAETDQSICEGYLNEIKLLADLQDGDCVIQMFDHEHQKENNMLFVVMEKGDTDLSKLIKNVSRSKKISAAMIVYYWTEMLNAVSFIHKRGTIHSDLKPANFLLVSGRLKLIDFGIASSVQEDMTSVVKDSLTGTYNYISPEALCSSDGQSYKISYKSDVWSLGCILYNLVYGRTPFQHISSQFQKMNAIVSPSHRIPYPEPIVEGCPSALIQAIKLCLVRNPKDRASVDDLLQLHYLEQVGPERGIISQFASLAASVGIVEESEDNRYAVVIRAMQRIIVENERHLPFLGGRK